MWLEEDKGDFLDSTSMGDRTVAGLNLVRAGLCLAAVVSLVQIHFHHKEVQRRLQSAHEADDKANHCREWGHPEQNVWNVDNDCCALMDRVRATKYIWN